MGQTSITGARNEIIIRSRDIPPTASDVFIRGWGPLEEGPRLGKVSHRGNWVPQTLIEFACPLPGAGQIHPN